MSYVDSHKLPVATHDMKQAQSDMDNFGYCLIADALKPETIAALHERLIDQADAELASDVKVVNAPHPDKINQWLTMLINKGDVLTDVLTNPAALGIARHVLGEEFLLAVYEAYVVRKGGSPMGLHCDQWWMPRPVAPSGTYERCGDITRKTVPIGSGEPAAEKIWAPVLVNVMFMITDFTEDNGATRLVPRTHLSGNQPDGSIPHPVPTVAGTGKAGTAVVWEGRTWHAAGVNHSGTPRIGLTATYCGPMFRQLTNFTLGTSTPVYDRASDQLKALLGFKLWETYGATDDPAAKFVERKEGKFGLLTLKG